MNPLREHQLNLTRRHFFGRSALGLGTAALASLMNEDRAAGAPRLDHGALGSPHFAPKAKRVIYLFMSGAPSQFETYDYKPKLREMFDVDLPESIRKGQRLTTMTSGQERFPMVGSKFGFKQCGKHGAWISELLPHTQKIADDLCIVKTMHADAINHDPAITFMQTGSQLPGRPSLGSWLSYGLGSMNAELPTFVVMTASWSSEREAQALYNRLWGPGFLPSKYAGVRLRSKGDPVLYLKNPPGVDRQSRRTMLDALNELNHNTLSEFGDPAIATRIAQYEMAYRMQSSVPELTDLSGETRETLDMYGPDVTTPGTFSASCLMARRLLERDVRCVQIYHRGWDQHGNLVGDLPKQCHDIDQASYALITDLKRRGLLEDTLVVWGGEFGRTVYCQGKLTKDNYGRDHHPRCWTMWMAGGGVKPGIVYGETDDFSYNIVKDPVHVHDLNATILNQMGIDHTRLTYRFQGRDFRLTDVHGKVVDDILT